MKNQFSTRGKSLDMAEVALFTVILAVCSWISIPTIVPFTLQTFGVYLAILLLGSKKATITILLYLAMGCIGLPVFSGGTAGIGILLGTTGGYMIGWIFQCLFMWSVERFSKKSRVILLLSMIAGLIICYSFGTAWFIAIYAENTGSIGWLTAIGWCVMPFVIPDLLKLFLALTIEKRIGATVKRYK